LSSILLINRPNASAKNGGIFFESLSAVDSKGNYFDFWSGVLGFDVSTLCVKYTKLYNVLNLPSSTIFVPNFVEPFPKNRGASKTEKQCILT
jgi:hypothetical protein